MNDLIADNVEKLEDLNDEAAVNYDDRRVAANEAKSAKEQANAATNEEVAKVKARLEQAQKAREIANEYDAKNRAVLETLKVREVKEFIAAQNRAVHEEEAELAEEL